MFFFIKKDSQLHLISFLILSLIIIFKIDKFYVLTSGQFTDRLKTWVVYILISENTFFKLYMF